MIAVSDKVVLIRDITALIKRNKLSLTVIFVSLITLIGYSHLTFSIEKEVYELNHTKSLLLSKNFELKKEITELSTPERINTIAKTDLGMVNVDYRQVKFIDVNK
ncbi:MAG: cell division protein FtsL [Hydrogenothermaceae bacterium]|nr:cell division protein FtsL [Hydrogenothermaceae bacterium]